MFSIRNSLTAIAIAVAVAACGGGGGSNNEPAAPVAVSPTGLMLLADGATLRAGTATATGYAETGSAAIPAADGPVEIFGVVVHPNKRWVYVTSGTRNWSDARLSRFAIDWTTGALSLVDSLPLTDGAGPSCAQGNNCAPVSMAVSADGTRLIVDESSHLVYATFAIAADGALSFVTESASGNSRLHGVGINAAGSYIYRGAWAYARSGDEITAVGNHDDWYTSGNASVVLNVGGTETLYTTLGLEQVAVMSLADPENPTTVSSIDPDLDNYDSAIFMDVTKDGKRMVSVGNNSVTIVDFDGTALTVQDRITITSGSRYARARGAAFNADGSLAAVSFQTGGAKLYAVAANGTLTEVASLPSFNTTRAVTFTTKP